MTKHIKMQEKKKKHSLKRQTSEPYSYIVQVLELTDNEFNISMSNMLRSLMGKANNIQDQMCNVSRETETLRIKKKFQKSKQKQKWEMPLTGS